MALPLEQEIARLRAAGFSDEQIRHHFRQDGGSSSKPAGGAPILNPMSGFLGNASAVFSHVRAIIPGLQKAATTVFNSDATRSARARSAGILIGVTVIVAALGFGLHQEWQQHIISATAIAEMNVIKAREEAASAHAQSCWNRLTPLLVRGTPAYDLWRRECADFQPESTAAADPKPKAPDYDALDYSEARRAFEGFAPRFTEITGLASGADIELCVYRGALRLLDGDPLNKESALRTAAQGCSGIDTEALRKYGEDKAPFSKSNPDFAKIVGVDAEPKARSCVERVALRLLANPGLSRSSEGWAIEGGGRVAALKAVALKPEFTADRKRCLGL
jgi:hypothetical protein